MRIVGVIIASVAASSAIYQAAGKWGWLTASIVTSIISLAVILRKEADRLVTDGRETLMRQVSDAIPGMVYQCRMYPTGRCALVYSNDAISWIYEKSLDDVEYDCSSILELVHPDDRPAIDKSLLQSALHLTPWKGEYRVILPKQGLRWRSAQASVERLPDGGTLWSGFIIDVTARKEADERMLAAEKQEAEALRVARIEERRKLRRLARANKVLREAATHDHLTGLYLRRYFDRRLPEIFEDSRGRRALTLMILDIDHFKAYNDTLGHLAGDRCLREVARALASSLNRKGQILARYGGEEFVAILPSLNSQRAGLLAEQLRQAVQDLKIPAADGVSFVSISIGVACMNTVPKKGSETSLLAAADEQLYEAKRQGRNCARVKLLESGRSAAATKSTEVISGK